MSDTTISSAAFADTKPHYELLDGLRGVAALLVVFYHIFEGLSFAAGGTPITTINHGYLAVDFFFILSGFVIGYAYDDRLGKTMTTSNFFKRRLIRLHPMIIMGVILGAIAFFIQGSVQWEGKHVAISAVMLSTLCAMFFIPALSDDYHGSDIGSDRFLHTRQCSMGWQTCGNLGSDAIHALCDVFHSRPTRCEI